jgi:orotidine-5'-phosphate decarboxylase
MKADNRLIVALDLPTVEEAHRLIERLGDAVSFYKIGLTLLAQHGGVGLAHALSAAGRKVFQDWKLHDIGAQVEGAARAVAQGGCDLLTVHAEPQVMRAAVAGCGDRGPKILGVTVMTSLNDADLEEMGYNFKAADLVERRARQALECGVDGVVASPQEAARIRAIADEAGRPDFLIVTPGVRPAGASLDDQQRVATPAAALQAGATHLVVGRPITAAPDPREAAQRIVEEMSRAGSGVVIGRIGKPNA